MDPVLKSLDWNLLRTFRSVSDAGSVSAAARILNREQPSVSAALKRLESHLGVTLCHRSNRGIDLTPAGQAVLHTAREIEHSMEDLATEIRKLQDTIDVTLRFQMISDVVSPVLDRALTRFHQAYPRVDIRIDIAPWRVVLQSVRAQEAALGIACDNAPSNDLVYLPLLYEAQQVYCGAMHSLYGASPMSPDRLCDEVFISTGGDEPYELFQFKATWGLGRRSCGEAETLHEARKLIKMGFGLGFLPTIVAEAADEALWPLLCPEILPRYPLYIVTNREEQQTKQTRQLLAAFLAEIGDSDCA